MKYTTLGLLGMLLVLMAGPASADCTVAGGYSAATAQLDFGQILIDGNTQPGDVLATARAVLPARSSALRCRRTFVGFGSRGGTRVLLSRARTAFSDTVFASGVPGVGIRLRQQPASNPFGLFSYDPYAADASQSFIFGGVIGISSAPVDRPQITLIAEAVRTGEPISAGRLTGGTFARLATDGGDAASNTILSAEVRGSVVGSTCQIAGASDITVVLPPVALSGFSATGNTAGSTPFSIRLACQGIEDARDRVSIAFDYTPAQGLSSSGVLSNAAADEAASGIGVQILDNAGRSIPPNTPANAKPLVNGPSRPGFNFKARYYQISSAPTAGRVRATARFLIAYP